MFTNEKLGGQLFFGLSVLHRREANSTNISSLVFSSVGSFISAAKVGMTLYDSAENKLMSCPTNMLYFLCM